jgi:hypothetical protein
LRLDGGFKNFFCGRFLVGDRCWGNILRLRKAAARAREFGDDLAGCRLGAADFVGGAGRCGGPPSLLLLGAADQIGSRALTGREDVREEVGREDERIHLMGRDLEWLSRRLEARRL